MKIHVQKSKHLRYSFIHFIFYHAVLIMAAAAFTVRMAIADCGVDDVALFNGETEAERIAGDLFSNEFGTCVDKTDTDLKEEMNNFANLTIANGRIRVAPGVHIAMKGFMFWASHCLRQGINPSTLPFPIANIATLTRQKKTHKKFCDDAEVNAKFPHMATFGEALKDADPDWRPIIPVWGKINADLGTTLSKVLTEDLDIQTALDDVAERAATIMEEAGYSTWK